MKEVKGKVAFITGAANGIGLGMATVFGRAGMKVVLTDIRQEDLDRAIAKLRADGFVVHGIRLDVTDRAAVARAADEAERMFGRVHLLCNNAGINSFGPMDEASYDDWDWVMGVNLNGVINGLVTFIPRIKRHGEGGHIVNTASMAAFVSGPGAGIYTATKFAVRGLSECLWYHLAPQNIGVSVLCPGLVNSHIYASEEVRPKSLGEHGYPVNTEFMQGLQNIHQLGMDPIEVGEKVLRAVQRADLYILTHPDHKEELKGIFEEILAAYEDEAPEPRRMAFEDGRRKNAAEVKKRGRAVLQGKS
ncbi:MAG: SDR family NAD(P)-dependent oxidoreductase [Gammaproteobacteria bacterium]|nr:SDR family NAD(P)-dependent oxidoreductase [Gammaproteobacteria bacterium]